MTKRKTLTGGGKRKKIRPHLNIQRNRKLEEENGRNLEEATELSNAHEYDPSTPPLRININNPITDDTENPPSTNNPRRERTVCKRELRLLSSTYRANRKKKNVSPNEDV